MPKIRQTVRRSMVIASFVIFEFFRFFHLLFSPVLIVIAASYGVINGSFITFIVLFLTSLFLGRAFCGWICPGNGLQEICSPLIRKKAGNARYYWIKYVVFSVWIFIIALAILQSGGLQTVDYFWGTRGSNLYQTLFLFLGALVIQVPLTFLLGKWAFCHYLCWLAPFMILGSRLQNLAGWPSLRLRTQREACHQCGLCNRECPMNLDVIGMVEKQSFLNPECFLCGSCVDACPSQAIAFSFSTAKSLS